MTLERPQASETASAIASADEVAHALVVISAADSARISEIAKSRAAGLPTMTWEDLMNEAATRALTGARQWPKEVPFVAFFAQTMRSIASEEWRRIHHDNVHIDRAAGRDDDGEPYSLDALAVDNITPERQEAARQILQKIDDVFDDDLEASRVLNGLAEGWSPDVIQHKYEMTATQYASTLRRIRRTLARHFPSMEDL